MHGMKAKAKATRRWEGCVKEVTPMRRLGLGCRNHATSTLLTMPAHVCLGHDACPPP